MRFSRPFIMGPRAAGVTLIVAGVVLLIALWLASPSPASAQLDRESPPPVSDPVSCGHFDSQPEAQDYLEATALAHPEVLDPDGDGVACEFAFGGEASEPAAESAESIVVVLPKTGSQPGSSGAGRGYLLVAMVMFSGALFYESRTRSGCLG